MRRSLLFCFFICLSSTLVYAQKTKTALLKGRLINSITKSPMGDKKVFVKGLDVFTSSDGEGRFEFSEIPYGNQEVQVNGSSVISVSVDANVDKPIVDMGDILVTPNDNSSSIDNLEIPTIAIEENTSSSDDDGVSGQNPNGIMVASKDPFISAIAFNFSAYYFQPRGAQRNGQEIQVNGITVNDLESGSASWSQLGGLSDVFHSRSVTYGLAPSPYTFGGIGGSTYFNATAADQRAGTELTYTASDRNYHNRIMLTHNSGLLENGWAYSISVSKRWAEQGYWPGTYYDGYSYYAAATKVIGRGQLSLTTFGSPTKHAKTAAATMECFNLAGTNYFNPAWGLQDGQVRSVNVQNVFQPNTILNYEYKPDENTRWNTAIGYEFGKDMTSGLYSYNGSPFMVGSYYRNLPSYQLTLSPPNPTLAATLAAQFKANPDLLQINWDAMYRANYADSVTITNPATGQNVISGRQSIYVVSDRVNDLHKFSFNSNIEHTVNENLSLAGGITGIMQQTESYEQIADLMGGSFFVDYNQYPTASPAGNPTYNSNNVLNPTGIVRQGDKWDYDYSMRLLNTYAWGQANYNINRFDFFLAANTGFYSFYRQSYFENGSFPTTSYGKSPTASFLTYGTKGGIDFKFDARNVLFLNAGYGVTPPTADNTYISPRTRSWIVNDPTVQTNKSIEGGYFRKGDDLSIRLDGYVNDANNVTTIKRFYNDDPAYYTYENYVMSGINTRSLGGEMAVNYRVYGPFSVTGVAAFGEVFYTNNPNVTVYLDNDTTQHPVTSKTYIKNYYISVGPQSAYTLGLNYRNSGWTASLNLTYMARNFVDINPDRRTSAAVGFALPGSATYNAILNQEELPSFYSVDAHVGKSWQVSRISKSISKLSKNAYLRANLGISNLLNNTHIIYYGYEQMRFDFVGNNPNMFPNKYVYGMGINFFLNIQLSF